MSTDYSDILLTSDGDVDLSSDNIVFISTNLESLRQRLNLRFAIWQGEWKYNEYLGTPYREYIGKAINKSTIDSEIKRQALLEPDAERISNFTSAFDRQTRLYSCSFDVETNEDSVSYGLVLKDGFDYIIPNYATDCEKIIRYRYVTSKPYPIFSQDYSSNYLGVNSGIIKDSIKNTENTLSSFAIDCGTLRDSLQQYTLETEYVENSCSVLGMTLTYVAPPVTPDYIAPMEDYVSAGSTVTSMTLTDVLIEYTQPLEDYVSASSSVLSMTLTG